jgi:hypothetical protein
MSHKLYELHKLTAEATISHKKFLGGLLTSEEFVKALEDINVHAHSNMVLHKHHADHEAYYKETIEGILRLYDQEKTK